MSSDREITLLLAGLREPDADATHLSDQLYSLLYPHLRDMAAAIMGAERADHTLQATALVNEAYLRLVDQHRTDWKSRSHFMAVAARIMRRVLTDHARGRSRLKRGGDQTRVTLHDDVAQREIDLDELITLDGALERLRALSERMFQVVELRVFGGMTVREIAYVVGVSERTADEDWSFARRWLAREIAGGDSALE